MGNFKNILNTDTKNILTQNNNIRIQNMGFEPTTLIAVENDELTTLTTTPSDPCTQRHLVPKKSLYYSYKITYVHIIHRKLRIKYQHIKPTFGPT